MKDHHPSPRVSTRYAALRALRRPLLLPPATRTEDTVDDLPAPIIHSTYNGGLRRDQLLGDFATVQVTVGPWDYADLTDTILLHWGDQWTESFSVKDTNGAQLLAIPGVDIAGDPLGNGDHYSGEGTQAIWYEVLPVGGELQPSIVQEVVVKTARPGGEDPRPDTPINDNLVAPTAAPDPVEQGTTEVIFSVSPWTNITTDDKLTLVLGGYRFDFPAITDITSAQTLILTAAQIAAIDGGPQTPVTYEIVDRVGNRSGYAPYLLLDIWLEAGDLLEMIELFDDAKNPIEGAIDPMMTAGFARVPRYAGWKPGESVTVVLEGVASDQQTHDTRLGPLTWTASDYYLDFPLPGDALLALAGGIVRVHYETSNGGISYRRLYVVDALPETLLPPVTVIGERGGELPLDAIASDYVSIVIPDSEALVDFSRVTLTMAGTGDSGPVSEEEMHNVGEGEGHASYTFAWTKTQVSKLLDHAATFSYTIRTLDGALAIHESEPHDLLIRKAGAPGQLAPPVVLDLVDGAVSPALPKLRLTVPAGTASVAGATVVTTVVGLTTETRTDRIFDDGEALTVDFPGWPAVNDGAAAKAGYTIDDKPSQEASFLVGVAEPFAIKPDLVELTGTATSKREATGGTPPYTYTSSAPGVVRVPDASAGDIQAVTDGDATITARDSAQGSGTYPVSVTGNAPPLFIDPSLVKLKVGETYPRRAHGGLPPYAYSSDAESIVELITPNTSTIRGLRAGEANITAHDSANGRVTYPVQVGSGAPAFYINPSNMPLTVGDNDQRQATGGTSPYRYVSAHPAIAAVHASTGVVAGHSPGSTIISASDSADHSGTYTVSVSAAFYIDPTTLALSVGGSGQRQATGGTPPYSYSSANPAVATVDTATGVVTAKTAGSTGIWAYDRTAHAASYPVVVGPAFFIDPSTLALSVGGSGQRQATGGTPPYSYASTSPAIATVNTSTGMVTANAAGSTTITASDSAQGSGTYPVKVDQGTPPFSIDPSTMALTVGGSGQRQATGGTPPYSYSSANAGVATVNTSTGAVTAEAAGSTTVTARDSAQGSGTYPVKVEAATPPFSIDPSTMPLTVGASKQRQGTGGTKPYSYASANPAIAAVHASTGVVTGKAAGSTIISAKDSAQGSGTYSVKVDQGTPPFAIDPSTMAMTVGNSDQRQATGGTQPYSYASANAAIATVNTSTGVVTAKAAGSTSIIASDSASHSGSYPVTVTAAFFIDPSTMELTVGASEQRQATGGTPPYSYSSGNVNVAAVDASTGVVTAKALGRTILTARDTANHLESYTVMVGAAFSIDPSTMGLTVGGSGQRQATGGTPPYGYTSANAAIAAVNASTGAVTANAAGSTTITANDRENRQGSYPVAVTRSLLTEDFEDVPDGSLPLVTDLPTMKITSTRLGICSIITTGFPAPYITGRCLLYNATVQGDDMHLEFPREFSHVRFGLHAYTNALGSWYIYAAGANGEILGSYRVEYEKADVWVDFYSSNGVKIKKIFTKERAVPHSVNYFDNFTFTP